MSLLVVGVSFLIGFIASSCYFAFHAIGALEIQLQDVYGLTDKNIGFMFTMYSMPNLVMTLVAGVAIERFGLKLCGALLTLTILMGVIIVAAAPWLGPPMMVPAMMAGRFLQGIAGESLVTWQQSACTRWFAGSQESLSMGTALAAQQLIGSASPFTILPAIDYAFDIDVALWFVVLYCAVCFLCVGLYINFERVHTAHLLLQDRAVPASPSNFDVSEAAFGGVTATLRSFSLLYWMECAYICFVITVLYVSSNFYPLFLTEHFGFSTVEAGNCTSLIYWFGVFAPVAGAITDRFGQRLWVQTIATFCTLCGFAALHNGNFDPWLCMAFTGMSFGFIEQNAYSLLARSMRVAGSPVGTGYGIEGVFCNAGQTVAPPLIAYLVDSTKTYSTQNFVYFGLLGCGLITSVAALIVDRQGVLNMTSRELEALEEAGDTAPEVYVLHEGVPRAGSKEREGGGTPPIKMRGPASASLAR